MIVDPRVDDHLRPRVVPEEQSELSADPGAPPMAVARAEGAALAVLVPGWILRDDLQHQPAQHFTPIWDDAPGIEAKDGLFSSLNEANRLV